MNFAGKRLIAGLKFYIMLLFLIEYIEIYKPIILEGFLGKSLLKHSSFGFSFRMRCSERSFKFCHSESMRLLV
jgi:hypothetical protein